MHIVNMNGVAKTPIVNPLFTGENVSIQPLAPEGGDFNMSVVNFGKGVRNKFHSHESDQILIITSGKGIVATEEEQREVSVGDIVVFPAGEKHWHGATKDSDFSHIYITRSDTKTKQLEE